MKVLVRQFLGNNHSWSEVGRGIATAFKKLGDEVHLFSTNGIENLPEHLKENVVGYVEENQSKLFGRMPDANYDMQISYTALKNFPMYLSKGNGTTNRFGIWSYEWAGKGGTNILPVGFSKNHHHCDKILAPSKFSKKVFIESGIPSDKIVVITHGINAEAYSKNTTMALPTKKRFKILANIAQNHLRKNIPGLLDAFGKAFSKNDDVCLILKAKEKPIKNNFEVSLNDCIKNFNMKFPQHAEVKIISGFIDDMSALYRSIDCVYTMSHCECFYFPGLEGLAAGKMSIAPNYGGQTDFLNNDNSLLIGGNLVRANPKSMYWHQPNNATWFEPNVDDAIEKLRFASKNFEKINSENEKNKTLIHERYNWDTVAKQMVMLTDVGSLTTTSIATSTSSGTAQEVISSTTSENNEAA